MVESRRPSWWVRAWIGGFLLILLAPLVPSGALGAVAGEPVREVARFPIFWPSEESKRFSGNGSMIINPAARRGYQIFRLDGARTFIQAVDLDTYRPAESTEFFGHPIPASLGGSNFGEFIHVVDEAKNRIYLPYDSSGVFGGVLELDGSSLKILRTMSRSAAFQPEVDPSEDPCTAASCLPTPPGISPEIRGLSFTPAIDSPASRDKLLMLLQDSTGPLSNNHSIIWVAQWDVQTARQDWIYRVNACSSRQLPEDSNTRYQLSLFQSPGLPYIYLACYGSGGTGQAVRLEQDGTSQPVAETSYPGPLGLTDVLGDPGANRLHMKIVNDEGESYWVFDGPSTSYVGVIGTTVGPSAAAAGLDVTTGRLYVLAPRSVARGQEDEGGLFVADARRSPAPQAVVYRDFVYSSVQRVLVDPKTEDRPRRVIVLPESGNEYIVIEDGVEVTEDPPAADQDRFTTDTQEVPGVTGSNFTGTAHAYGLRSVFVGGVEGTSPTRGTPLGSPLLFVGSPCMKPDREVVVGRIRSAALSNSLASAVSLAGDAEATTRTDVQQPINRCAPRGFTSETDALADQTIGPIGKAVDAAAGREWPFEEAECAGDGEKTQQAADLGGYRASVSCKQSKELVSASAVGEAFGAQGLSVGQAYTSVQLGRKLGRGLTVRSEAFVRGISVPGAFSIDAARTVATAFAAGRPGTAGTEFEREICGIRIAGAALGQKEDVFFEGCYDPFDQIEQIGTQTIVNNAVTDRPLVFLLNRALGTRGRIRVPDPDEELKKGTPGGYLASVQKNRGEEIQARVISNDASTEVPAFELIMFNDDVSSGRARQLYQFAGVDASATYGIFLPPTFEFDGGGSDGLDAGDFTLPNVLTELTGGLPVATSTKPLPAVDASSGPTNGIADIVNRVARTLELFVRSPREAVLSAAVWLLLGLPVYLAARRRLLLARRTT